MKITIPPALESLSDNELARIFGCSRTAVIFARRRQNHQCVKCGRPVTDGTQHCSRHKAQVRKYQRTRNQTKKGFKPWQPGRRGRKPLDQKGKAA